MSLSVGTILPFNGVLTLSFVFMDSFEAVQKCGGA